MLCFGITPDNHEWLQTNAGDVEACAEYLDGNGIVSCLAHPFYAVAAPLRSRHRRRLAELFPVWETRNGSRARELNMPAAIYVETQGGIAIGGSDDHAGIDIGRTFTSAPPATTPDEFLEHVRAGRVVPGGEQGSIEKWAHAAMALTVRALGRHGERAQVDPARVLAMAERLLREGDRREGSAVGNLAPADARALLRAWLASVELDELSEADLVAYMQDERFTHADLHRRAIRAHERLLRGAVTSALDAAARGSLGGMGGALFAACIPAIPYAPSAAFIARERAKLSNADGELPRVAIVADGIGAMHGVTRTIEEIRERGIAGFEIEVIGTDPNVDRRLGAVADVEIPHYPGMHLGVPSLPAVVEAITQGRYDLIHVCSPGPSGVAAAVLARAIEIPLLGSYHTELAAYAGLRTGDASLEGRRRARRGRLLRPVPAGLLTQRGSGRHARERSGSAPGASPAGIVGSTPPASTPTSVTSACCPASSASSTPGASARRRTSTCSRRRSRWRTRAIRGSISCLPAAGRSSLASRQRSAITRRSSVGSRGQSSRLRMQAPTRSVSRARPTRSARSCSKRRRVGFRSSPSRQEAPGT